MLERSAVLFHVAGPILGAAILWIQYFDLKDALRKEPRRMLVFGFFLGALAAVLAYGCYGILEQFGWETADMGKAEAARAIEPLCMLWCIPGFIRNEWGHAFKLLVDRSA